jgi:hypothetical protein
MACRRDYHELSKGLRVIGLFIGIDPIFYRAVWIVLGLGLRASL